MHPHTLITTTTATESEAHAIAAALLNERLAACVQVFGPIQSHYRWEGAVEVSEEWQCAVKTLSAAWPQVEAVIKRTHSYDNPQVVALPIVAGCAEYLDWIEDSVNVEGS